MPYLPFDPNPKRRIRKPNRSWVCAREHWADEGSNPNKNKHLTDVFEELMETYVPHYNDKDAFRERGTMQVISILQKFPEKVLDAEQLRHVRGIGPRTLNKIREILETGELRAASFARNTPEFAAIQLFQGIHGVGPVVARRLVTNGYRTLEDLKIRAWGDLSRVQQIGVTLYHDLNQRMTREEAGEIGRIVMDEASKFVKGLKMEICGSYRRLKKSCGDVDVLISHPDGVSHNLVFYPLIESLTRQGLLTHDLVRSEQTGSQVKYMGIFKLSHEGAVHRRLDIIVVPWDEWACSLLYFTGSGHFNRSMRLLARKNGWSLSQHCLSVNVLRNPHEQSTKLQEGEPVYMESEQQVFEYLGLTYIPPEGRNA